MKFGKLLASQMAEMLPEWRDKFLSYKQLKKKLKSISAPDCFTEAAFVDTSPERDGKPSVVDAAMEDLSKQSGAPADACNEVKSSEEDSEFTRMLEDELEKFNIFFLEKEEEFVIRLQELKSRSERIIRMRQNEEDSDELTQLRSDIVKFHGEMVLLLNYSALNYTGLVKILKKHDKHTRTSLGLTFIRGVLKQPFFKTELLTQLVQDCEENLKLVFPPSELSEMITVPEHPLPSAQDGEEAESIYRSTVAALRTIRDMRSGSSSTYGDLSLPPLVPQGR